MPAYRGTCYLVFDNMTLDDFGNRMPQITAEIIRTPADPRPGRPDQPPAPRRAAARRRRVRARHDGLKSSDGFGNWFPENQHTPNGAHRLLRLARPARADAAGLAQPCRWSSPGSAPTCAPASCQIVPKVETWSQGRRRRLDWSVAGFDRATRRSSSARSTRRPSTRPGSRARRRRTGPVPAFGGTPCRRDASPRRSRR